MYTLRDTQEHNVRNSDMRKIQPRTQLASFIGGPRITVRGFLDFIAPHYPYGESVPYLNPIFKRLKIVGHDVSVHHAHIMQQEFVGRRSAVDRLQDSVKSVCQFTANVASYFKDDKQTGRRYTDYKFVGVESTIKVTPEEEYDYDHWCYEMGYLTPPSSEGRFADNNYDYAKDEVPRN
jgi:hypothetical protein